MWLPGTCFSSHGIAAVQAAQREALRIFAPTVRVDKLYAAAGSLAEIGGRPYWLFRTVSAAYITKKSIKCEKTKKVLIKANNFVVKILWYEAESVITRSYTLKPGVTYLPLQTVVQENGLEFDRAMRDGGVLSTESHLRLIQHNYSNYK